MKNRDDTNDDQGNSEKGRGLSQGKGNSTRKERSFSQRSSSDTDKRSKSDTQVLTKPMFWYKVEVKNHNSLCRL